MATFRVLCWNLHGRPRALEFAENLCRARAVDLFVGAEVPRGATLTSSPTARLAYRIVSSGYTVEEFAAYDSAAALRVRRAGAPRDLTLVAVHLPSRLYLRNEEDQRLAADRCRGFIEDGEGAPNGAGHDRTVVVGDFNLDPFSPAMVGIAGFNAMMTRRRVRQVDGLRRACFYNPMWNLLGDASGSPGTYHLGRPGALGYYWHVLDQALFREAIVDHLEDVRIVDDDHLISARARRPHVSDHLPVELTLNTAVFEKEVQG